MNIQKVIKFFIVVIAITFAPAQYAMQPQYEYEDTIVRFCYCCGEQKCARSLEQSIAQSCKEFTTASIVSHMTNCHSDTLLKGEQVLEITINGAQAQQKKLRSSLAKNYMCCNRAYLNYSLYYEHTQRSHCKLDPSVGNSLECRLCGTIFVSRYLLEQHILVIPHRHKKSRALVAPMSMSYYNSAKNNVPATSENPTSPILLEEGSVSYDMNVAQPTNAYKHSLMHIINQYDLPEKQVDVQQIWASFEASNNNNNATQFLQ